MCLHTLTHYRCRYYLCVPHRYRRSLIDSTFACRFPPGTDQHRDDDDVGEVTWLGGDAAPPIPLQFTCYRHICARLFLCPSPVTCSAVLGSGIAKRTNVEVHNTVGHIGAVPTHCRSCVAFDAVRWHRYDI